MQRLVRMGGEILNPTHLVTEAAFTVRISKKKTLGFGKVRRF
jgi:hypothetical protein